MNDYTHVVLVRHNNGRAYLYEAPSYPTLKIGDMVLCEPRYMIENPTLRFIGTTKAFRQDFDALCNKYGIVIEEDTFRQFVGKCVSGTLYLNESELDAMIVASMAKRPLRRVVGLVEVTKLTYENENPASGDDTGEAMDG